MAKDLGEINVNIGGEGADGGKTRKAIEDLHDSMQEINKTLKRLNAPKAQLVRTPSRTPGSRAVQGAAEAAVLAGTSRRVSASAARVLTRVFTALRTVPIIGWIVAGLGAMAIALVSVVKFLNNLTKRIERVTRSLARYNGVIMGAVVGSRIGQRMREIQRAGLLGPQLAQSELMREQLRQRFEPLLVVSMRLQIAWERMWTIIKGKLLTALERAAETLLWILSKRDQILPFLGIVGHLMSNTEKGQGTIIAPLKELLDEVASASEDILKIYNELRKMTSAQTAEASNRWILNGMEQLTDGKYKFSKQGFGPAPAFVNPPGPVDRF